MTSTKSWKFSTPPLPLSAELISSPQIHIHMGHAFDHPYSLILCRSRLRKPEAARRVAARKERTCSKFLPTHQRRRLAKNGAALRADDNDPIDVTDGAIDEKNRLVVVVERFRLQNNCDYKYLANFTSSSSNRILLREVIFSIRIDYYWGINYLCGIDYK